MKHRNVVKKFYAPAIAASFVVLPLSSFAAGVADIAAGVDFADVETGVVAIMVAVASVLVIFAGGKMLLRAVRGAA